jgi:hypothetical protein
MIWVLGFIIWTALGFVIWVFLTAGADYRRPVSEADIKALADEADRVVRLGDQHPVLKPSHSNRIAERTPQDHV